MKADEGFFQQLEVSLGSLLAYPDIACQFCIVDDRSVGLRHYFEKQAKWLQVFNQVLVPNLFLQVCEAIGSQEFCLLVDIGALVDFR